MTDITTFGAPPPDGWYYINIADRGPQWINIAQAIRMFANGKGGTTIIWIDGNVTDIVETINPPAATPAPQPAQPAPEPVPT